MYVSKLHEKCTVNGVISKITDDFKKIVAVTKLKGLKRYAKNILPNYKKWNIRPIKVGKQSGTTYCFGCKDYTKNFRSEKVKITNKILREKSHCVACWSNKSRFKKKKKLIIWLHIKVR